MSPFLRKKQIPYPVPEKSPAAPVVVPRLRSAEWSPSGIILIDDFGKVVISPKDIGEARSAIKELRLYKKSVSLERQQVNGN